MSEPQAISGGSVLPFPTDCTESKSEPSKMLPDSQHRRVDLIGLDLCPGDGPNQDIGLAMKRPGLRKARSTRTIALVLPVASMTISSSGLSFLANRNRRLYSRSIFPASRSLPFSRMAVWANDRCTSRANDSRSPAPSRFNNHGSRRAYTTTTDPRSQRNRASRRGRPDNNSVSSS